MKKIISNIFVLFFVVMAISASPRVKFTINEQWHFQKGEITSAELVDFDDSKWEVVNLPHTWNIKDVEDESYGYYRGVGWYRKNLEVDNSAHDKNIYLCFEAANQVTEVWINGKKAGEKHIGGYTPFVYDITDLLKIGKSNIVAVKVDNSHNNDIAPLSADFTFYGGIYRDVQLVYTNKVHFDMLQAGATGVYITTPQISETSATIEMKSKQNLNGVNGISLRHTIKNAEGQVVATNFVKLKKQVEDISRIKLTNPILWDTKNPYLYTVTSELVDKNGNIVDQVENRLGIRYFSFDNNKGFFLNGKHLKLIGSSRHQDYLHQGNALTDDMHRYDMKLLKEMGFNCLRISHYPQDPSVLEMCDRYGFICFEETPIVNYINQSEAFDKNCKSAIHEMIMRDYNHPCIVAWNSSNEITVGSPEHKKWSDQEKATYDQYLQVFLKGLDDYIKSVDITRASMIVHCYDAKANAKKYHNGDFIGYNKYLGWYEGEIEDITSFIDNYRIYEPNRPMFMSEYGVGADVRIHSFNPTRFDHSEEYQLKFFKYDLKAILEHDFVIGGTMWNFNDFNSEFRHDVLPHINPKGLVTADRRPKASYYYHKALLTDQPFICIPSQLWTVRGGKEDADGAGVCTQTVEVFGNTKQVELFVNGKSLGVKEIVEHSAIYNVPFTSNENLLELCSKDNSGKLLKDFLKVNFQLQPFNLKSKTLPFKEISINCGSYCYFNDDTRNNFLWVPDEKYTAGYCGYIGGSYYRREKDRIGSDTNIKNTTQLPVYQTQLRGLTSYRFDVPDGNYELTLLFAELDTKPENERVFDVSVNEQKVIEDLNIAKRYGANRAVFIRCDLKAEIEKGICVDFNAVKGETILNGISLRKVY